MAPSLHTPTIVINVPRYLNKFSSYKSLKPGKLSPRIYKQCLSLTGLFKNGQWLCPTFWDHSQPGPHLLLGYSAYKTHQLQRPLIFISVFQLFSITIFHQHSSSVPVFQCSPIDFTTPDSASPRVTTMSNTSTRSLRASLIARSSN